MRAVRNPGFAAQGRYRTLFRIVGVVFTIAGVVLLVMYWVGFGDSISSTVDTARSGASASIDASSVTSGFFDDMPTMWVGVLVLCVGISCLKAGFLGAATRYVAGETMPVVKDSLEYLTDGEGIINLGRAQDSVDGFTSTAASGPFCTHCGTRNDAAARFCDNCGAAING